MVYMRQLLQPTRSLPRQLSFVSHVVRRTRALSSLCQSGYHKNRLKALASSRDPQLEHGHRTPPESSLRIDPFAQATIVDQPLTLCRPPHCASVKQGEKTPVNLRLSTIRRPYQPIHLSSIDEVDLPRRALQGSLQMTIHSLRLRCLSLVERLPRLPEDLASEDCLHYHDFDRILSLNNLGTDRIIHQCQALPSL